MRRWGGNPLVEVPAGSIKLRNDEPITDRSSNYIEAR